MQHIDEDIRAAIHMNMQTAADTLESVRELAQPDEELAAELAHVQRMLSDIARNRLGMPLDTSGL